MQKSLLHILLFTSLVLTACTSTSQDAQESFDQGNQLLIQEKKYNEAAEMLLHALALQDTKKPTELLTRTYEHLSRCYWNQEYDNEALKYARLGYNTSLMLDNDSLQSQQAIRMASCHYTCNNYDSARYYYEQVRAKSFLSHDSTLLVNTINNIGAVLLSQAKFQEALAAFDESMLYSHHNDYDCFKYHYNRSRCFSHLGQWEDCINEIKISLQYTPDKDFDGKQKLYKRLYSCLKKMEQYQEACHSADSVFMYTDSIYVLRHREELKDITSKFQQEQHEAEMRLMQSHWILAVVNGVFIVIILVVVIMYRHKRRILQLEDELHSLNARIAIEEDKQGKPTEQKEVHTVVPVPETLSSLYMQQLNIARELFRSRPTYDRLQQLKFHTDKNYLPDEQRLPLIDSVTEVFLDPIQRLRSAYPELTADECLYAILTFIGCSNAVISMLTKTTEATLRKRRSRIKQKTTERVFSFLIEG